MHRTALFAAAWRTLAHVRDGLLGAECALCGTPGPDICIHCRAALVEREGRQLRCSRCAEPLPVHAGINASPVCARCAATPPAFDRAICAADYASPLDGIEVALKFAHRADLARALGALLSDAIGAAEPAPTIDVLVPVPLAAQRLAERGYNQAALIARHVARVRKLPLELDTLVRLRTAAPSSSLARNARADAVRDAFAARLRLDERHVGLVDDVMTTGATMHEAARALKAAGARTVVALAPLRTAPETD